MLIQSWELWQVFHSDDLDGYLGVDAQLSGSFLWWNDVFSLGTFYSNAYGD
jgi:hypothetical protein